MFYEFASQGNFFCYKVPKYLHRMNKKCNEEENCNNSSADLHHKRKKCYKSSKILHQIKGKKEKKIVEEICSQMPSGTPAARTAVLPPTFAQVQDLLSTLEQCKSVFPQR